MPTTNPVPSQDPSDLLFNAGKLDEVVNGAANSFTDRLGIARRTVAGMNADFDAQLADAESDLNVYRADAAASAAEALGYLQTIRATSYGAYASDPATDPLGNPPTVGDEYFNTTANLLKRWNGTTWQASDISTANLAASSGSSLVGYDGGTVQDVLDALTAPASAVSVSDFMTSAQIADVTAGTALIDLTASIQEAINFAKTLSSVAVASTSIRYGSKAVKMIPGVYLSESSIVCDADVSLVCDTFGGALIKYTGSGKALIVNSETTAAPGAQNTRVWEMNGVSIFAQNATHCVFIGASAQRHLSIKRGQVYGAQYGIYAAEAVYFLGIKQVDVRGCQIGVFAGEYCDLLTIDDRCLFNGNSVCDVILQCPTFHITNNDFEGGAPAIAAIKIQHINGAEGDARSGVIFDNRFGPESPNSSPSYLYDIWLYDNGASGAMSGIKIIYNKHFSYTDTRQKLWPVYIEGKTKRMSIEGNSYSGYASLYVGGDATKAFAGGAAVTENFVNDIFAVTDTLKGLFSKTSTKNVTPVISASSSITKLSTVRYAGLSSGNGFAAPSVGLLAAGVSAGNYRLYAGIALHDGVANRILWISQPGLMLDTSIDASAAAIGDPVYMNGSGGLQLTPVTLAFPVGKVLAATANTNVVTTSSSFTNTYFGTATFNPMSLPDGSGEVTTVTVTGAALGDFVELSFSLDLQGVIMTAWISAADTVSVRFQNETGSTVDLSGGTLRVKVTKL